MHVKSIVTRVQFVGVLLVTVALSRAVPSAILGRGSYLWDLGRRTMLNRGVVIVRPKQPYLDWAAGLDDSELVPDPNAEQTVYLIPVPLPVSWTREGDIKIAPSPSIVDPDATVRSGFIGHAAIAAVRAAIGV